MIRIKKHGRAGPQRSTLRSYFPALLTLALLIPIQSANADAQTTSGTINLGNTLIYGTTSYSVDYSYPSKAQVGSNLNVTLTMHVNSETGLVTYTSHYQFLLDVIVGEHHLNASISGGNNTALPIAKYPGSIWGPNTVAIPLTVNNTGLAKGQSSNATVTVTLEDLIWYGPPLSLFDTEPPMSGGIGSLTVQNSVATSSSSGTDQTSGQNQTYLPYALLASGVVLMLSAVFLPRASRPPQANPK